MISQRTKEKTGLYRSVNKALDDNLYGKIVACYIIAQYTGGNCRDAVDRYNCERKGGKSTLKQAVYCIRLVTRHKYTEDDYQDFRIFLARYKDILTEAGYRPIRYIKAVGINVTPVIYTPVSEEFLKTF